MTRNFPSSLSSNTLCIPNAFCYLGKSLKLVLAKRTLLFDCHGCLEKGKERGEGREKGRATNFRTRRCHRHCHHYRLSTDSTQRLSGCRNESGSSSSSSCVAIVVHPPLPPTVQVNRVKAPKTSVSVDADLNFRRAIRSNPLLPRSCRRRRRMSGFGSPYLHFRQMHGSHSPCPAARPPPKNTKSADCARAAASSTADSRKAACTEDNRIGWRHFGTLGLRS